MGGKMKNGDTNERAKRAMINALMERCLEPGDDPKELRENMEQFFADNVTFLSSSDLDRPRDENSEEEMK